MGIFKKKKDDMAAFLYAQQGELDAVLMYEKLAAAVTDDRDRKTFERLAKDEQRHADVFFAFTKDESLKPKKTKAVAVPFMYKVLGKKAVYPLIALGEYQAVWKYRPVAKKYDEVKTVKSDERHHGNAVLALLREEK